MFDDNTILPVEEMMNYDEFTDRVEILRDLDEWVKNISRMGSGSTSIISPRRLGKTSLLDRLVNTVFFQDYNVVPFYFSSPREKAAYWQFSGFSSLLDNKGKKFTPQRCKAVDIIFKFM